MKVFYLILMILACLIAAIICFELLSILLIIISSLFINTKKISNKNNPYFRFLLNFATDATLFLDKIHIHTTGEEIIPKDQRFLLVCNHRSKFDPITTWHVLKKQNVSFITKPENLKVPFFGKIIQRCCFMPIDRESPKNAISTIERAAFLLKNDVVSVGVYPEGTRSKDLELLPFHAMVFKIAIKAEVPIVVMTAYKTESIAKNFPFKKSDVYLDFLQVIPVEEVKASRSVALSDKCEALIRAKLDEYKSKEI